MVFGAQPAPALPLTGHRPAMSTSSDEEEEEPSFGGGPASPAYDSMQGLEQHSAQHCRNCTGSLWGHICLDCGHMPAHDDALFRPAPATRGSEREVGLLAGGPAAVLAYDERMLLHEEGPGSSHPERPDRIAAVWGRLQAAELDGRCRRLPVREATVAELRACHTERLIASVAALSDSAAAEGETLALGGGDTYVNAHTAACARLSAGACVDVAVAVARGQARTGLAVVRPPGHHAESNVAMGFCFFNNAAVAARAAQAAGAERVLILDWDVHHGNGGQHIFEHDASVLYCSLHRWDDGSFFPGTGGPDEVGEGAGEGFTVNVPWPCGGMRDMDYLAAFNHVVMPIAYEFAPQLVIISAGFDAAEGDPIGGCHVSPEGFAHMTALLQLVAPCVALLEGGYNLLATARATEACARVLLGERPPPLPDRRPASAAALGAIVATMETHAPHWACMRGLAPQPVWRRTLPAPAPAPAFLATTDSDSPLYEFQAGPGLGERMAPHAAMMAAGVEAGQLPAAEDRGPALPWTQSSGGWGRAGSAFDAAAPPEPRAAPLQPSSAFLQPDASALADDCLLPSAALEPSASIEDGSRQENSRPDGDVQSAGHWGKLALGEVPVKTEGIKVPGMRPPEVLGGAADGSGIPPPMCAAATNFAS